MSHLDDANDDSPPLPPVLTPAQQPPDWTTPHPRRHQQPFLTNASVAQFPHSVHHHHRQFEPLQPSSNPPRRQPPQQQQQQQLDGLLARDQFDLGIAREINNALQGVVGTLADSGQNMLHEAIGNIMNLRDLNAAADAQLPQVPIDEQR
jgi:hypothetical protein